MSSGLRPSRVTSPLKMKKTATGNTEIPYLLASNERTASERTMPSGNAVSAMRAPSCTDFIQACDLSVNAIVVRK